MPQRYMVIAGTVVAPDEQGERRTCRVGEVVVLEPDVAQGIIANLRPLPNVDVPAPAPAADGKGKSKGKGDAPPDPATLDAARKEHEAKVRAAQASQTEAERAALVNEWLNLPLGEFGEAVGQIHDEKLLLALANEAKARELHQDYALICSLRASNLLHPHGRPGDGGVDAELIERAASQPVPIPPAAKPRDDADADAALAQNLEGVADPDSAETTLDDEP